MNIAVLITVFNRKQKTLECLDRLYCQDFTEKCDMEVYLTNDGCTDGTPEAVRLRYPSVHIINGDGNLFWNRGMYVAWCEAEKTQHDYYMWLNDDTLLFDDAVEYLLKLSKEKDDKAIIIGTTLDTGKKHLTYGGFDRHGHLITDIKEVTECYTWNGNIVLIPKYVYEHIGKNDPIFHHAIGDTDYGLRARKVGISSFLSDRPCGTCDLHPSMPKWKDSTIPMIKRFKYLYMPGGNGSNPIQFFIFKRRHYGLIKAIGTFISNHLHTLLPQLWR